MDNIYHMFTYSQKGNFTYLIHIQLITQGVLLLLELLLIIIFIALGLWRMAIICLLYLCLWSDLPL
jgi:hypothetical protein